LQKTDLSTFNNNNYKSGNFFARVLWYFINTIFFKSSWFPFSRIKIFILRLFGAKIGSGVVIKPSVNIKYPWKLEVGNYVWIGEYVWIDNLDNVIIANNSCISQGAMLLCGNHDFSSSTFDLITKSIVIEEGAWIGARSVICPGVRVSSHAVLTVGSIANSDLNPYCIYKGNPAKKISDRIIK
jgi:putative colanic acid biosynthesis acetyltransferase WcaF